MGLTLPVDSRTTSSGSNMSTSRRLESLWLSIIARTPLTMDWQILSTGWWTEVREGDISLMKGESSYPATETSPGTDRFMLRAALMAPRAN